MQFLSKMESLDWIRSCKATENSSLKLQNDRVLLNTGRGIAFELPADCGSRLILAKEIAALSSRAVVLLIYTDWGISDTREHSSMFYRFRESFGEKALLIDRPGQLLALPQEAEDLVSFLAFAMLFNWDCYVIPELGEYCYINTHHELSYLGLQNDVQEQSITETLSNMNVQVESLSKYRGKATSFIAS